MAKLENNWSIRIEEDGKVLLDERIQNASTAQEADFKTKVREYLTPPESDACADPENVGGNLGSLSWYGGLTAARSWVLYRCQACGKIHGRLAFMS